jgi:hypothetical protein
MMIAMVVGSIVSAIVMGNSSPQIFLIVNLALIVAAGIVILFLPKPKSSNTNI